MKKKIEGHLYDMIKKIFPKGKPGSEQQMQF